MKDRLLGNTPAVSGNLSTSQAQLPWPTTPQQEDSLDLQVTPPRPIPNLSPKAASARSGGSDGWGKEPTPPFRSLVFEGRGNGLEYLAAIATGLGTSAFLDDTEVQDMVDIFGQDNPPQPPTPSASSASLSTGQVPETGSAPASSGKKQSKRKAPCGPDDGSAAEEPTLDATDARPRRPTQAAAKKSTPADMQPASKAQQGGDDAGRGRGRGRGRGKGKGKGKGRGYRADISPC